MQSTKVHYLEHDQTLEASDGLLKLQEGALISGVLCGGSRTFRPGYLQDFSRLRISDVTIPDLFARNRAINGDVVIVKLYSERSYRELSQSFFADADKLNEWSDFVASSVSEDLNELYEEKVEETTVWFGVVLRIVHREASVHQQLCRVATSQRSSNQTLFVPLESDNVPVICNGEIRDASSLYLVSWDSSWTRSDLLPHGTISKVFLCALDRDDPARAPRESLAAIASLYHLEPALSTENAAKLKKEEMEMWNAIMEECKHPSFGRVDLDHLDAFTIDPIGSRDLDDAITVEAKGPFHFQVGVHVADVAFAVRPGTLIDQYAQARGFSTYLPNKTHEMLPHSITTALSLYAGHRRLVVSSYFDVEVDSGVIKPVFTRSTRSVIRSRGQLSYEQVDALFEGKTVKHMIEDEKVIEALNNLKYMLPALAHANAPTIDLSAARSTEPIFDFDSAGCPTKVRSVLQDTAAHRLVEMLMLQSNACMLRRLLDMRATIPFRTQKTPKRVDKMIEIAVVNGANRPKGTTVNDAISAVQEANLTIPLSRRPIMHMQLARTQLKARMECVSAEELARAPMSYMHFHRGGLYCQGTSPLRRYTDLLTQRALLGDFLNVDNNLVGLVEHCNRREAVSKRAQRSAVRMMLQLLAARAPFRCEATITQVGGSKISLGFFDSIGIEPCDVELGRMVMSPSRDGLTMRVKWQQDAEETEIHVLQKLTVALCCDCWKFTDNRMDFMIFPFEKNPAVSVCTFHMDHPREFSRNVPLRLDFSSQMEYRKSLMASVQFRAIAEAMFSTDYPVVTITPAQIRQVNDSRIEAVVLGSDISDHAIYAVCVRCVDFDRKNILIRCTHGLATSQERTMDMIRRSYMCEHGMECKNRTSGRCIGAHFQAELRQMQTKLVIDLARPFDALEDDVPLNKWLLELIPCHPGSASIHRTIGGNTGDAAVMERLIRPRLPAVPGIVTEPEKIKPLMNLFDLNAGQQKAVQRALVSTVYNIVGPPGTGKTTTAAALIITHLALHDNKILICAPSNKAADVLTSMLAPMMADHMPNKKLLRVYSRSIEGSDDDIVKEMLDQHQYSGSRTYKTHPVPDAIRGVSLHLIARKYAPLAEIRSQYELGFSSFDLVKRFRTLLTDFEKKAMDQASVIVCTCAVAAEFRMYKRRFSLVLVDECAQATEPEAVVPALRADQQLILIGDPMQIGPVLSSFSREVRSTSQVSLMERLMNESSHSVLTEQYRMHSALRRFPSFAFYHDRLFDAPIIEKRPLIAKTFPWPNLKFGPLAFVAMTTGNETCPDDKFEDISVVQSIVSNRSTEISGQSSRAFSYYNNDEALVAALAVKVLVEKCGLKQSSIAIVSPYQAQRDHLRFVLGSQYKDVEIGTVHSFQGSERSIVIVSFVRTNEAARVGFIDDDRLLNVALTRAKHGLICLASKKVLHRVARLKQYADFASRQGCMMTDATFYDQLEARFKHAHVEETVKELESSVDMVKKAVVTSVKIRVKSTGSVPKVPRAVFAAPPTSFAVTNPFNMLAVHPDSLKSSPVKPPPKPLVSKLVKLVEEDDEPESPIKNIDSGMTSTSRSPSKTLTSPTKSPSKKENEAPRSFTDRNPFTVLNFAAETDSFTSFPSKSKGTPTPSPDQYAATASPRPVRLRAKGKPRTMVETVKATKVSSLCRT